MVFIIFILSGISLTNIIVNALILANLKESYLNLYEGKSRDFQSTLLNCMMCTGFWVGILLSLLFPSFFVSSLLVKIIVGGLLISLGSHFYSLIIDFASFLDKIEFSSEEGEEE